MLPFLLFKGRPNGEKPMHRAMGNPDGHPIVLTFLQQPALTTPQKV